MQIVEPIPEESHAFIYYLSSNNLLWDQSTLYKFQVRLIANA